VAVVAGARRSAGLQAAATCAYLPRMVIPRSRLSFLYGVIALVALLATWHQNLHYLAGPGGFVGANVRFWKDTFAVPAGASITLDLLLFGLAVTFWMVLEARRLGMRFVWVYVALGFLIAISFTFPLFLMARERRLTTLGQVQPAIGPGDVVGLLLVGVPIVAIALWSLFA
jgi:hypothetical protein